MRSFFFIFGCIALWYLIGLFVASCVLEEDDDDTHVPMALLGVMLWPIFAAIECLVRLNVATERYIIAIIRWRNKA